MSRPDIKVGQVYRSKHIGDIERNTRQRRRVVRVDLSGPFVYLLTEDGPAHLTARPSRVRLRSANAYTIPGHALVEDVPA